ncbi:hypothetical protein AB0E55_20830 [Amycolatopsis keratiniphila]|uniref:hypothetical protein n=1 Tax=Amycolatopsis keratiniphila TaxID=129921 RepID=UPI0033F0AA20
MITRMVISRDSTTLECERCGHPAVHVARLVADNGGEVGQTLVCTFCRPHRADRTTRDERD